MCHLFDKVFYLTEDLFEAFVSSQKFVVTDTEVLLVVLRTDLSKVNDWVRNSSQTLSLLGHAALL